VPAVPEDETLVFAGSASPRLAAAICRHLGVEGGRGEVLRFSEGTLFVRVLQNVRGRRVYLVQSTALARLRASIQKSSSMKWSLAGKTESVTALIPYFSYGKGDKKDEPRVSIRARVCADAIESAGADRVVTMDLHAPQIQGFFRAPVDDLYAVDRLCAALRRSLPERPVVVSPDAGFAKKARAYAERLHAPLAIADKTRAGHEERTETVSLIGDVVGQDAILVDDFTVSGGTLIEAAEELRRCGARSVIAAITHAVFAPGTAGRLEASPIERLFVTDTVETQPEPLGPRVEVVSVAPLFAEAIRRIHRRESISSLFTGEPARNGR
jgi:ribose-phosphate pyrophosphokinase